MLELPVFLLKVLQSCRTLPSVPAVVLQVLDLAQDPDIGTSRIAKVLERDPALSAKILRVANSPWCGVRNEVTTLDRAVNLLGINGTMSLALCFSLAKGQRRSKGSRFDHQFFWRRSVIAAAATRAVGLHLRAANRDELFVAGLLQDIGMLVLNEATGLTYGPLVACSCSDHAVLIEGERKLFGTDHAQVGSWMLTKWGLPGRLITAVSGSHDPDSIGRTDQLLAKSVALGGRIAEIWVNPQIASATAAAREAADSLLNVSAAQFEGLLGVISAELPEATANMDIDLGGEQFVNRMLDQAREAIAELNLRALQEAREFALQAQRDDLTSLYNRTYLSQILRQQFDISRSMGKPLTVVFLDVDNFKAINDSYGHHGGDAVLISVAQVLQSATRGFDTIVRFGGDEFVVLLTNTGEDVGAVISERIRATVEQQPHNAGEGHWIQVTVSVGCATMSPSSTFLSEKELLEAADRSLYAAKSGGRNRVAHAI